MAVCLIACRGAGGHGGGCEAVRADQTGAAVPALQAQWRAVGSRGGWTPYPLRLPARDALGEGGRQPRCCRADVCKWGARVTAGLTESERSG